MNDIVSNSFGEQSLFTINRNVFQHSDASSVFRAYFGDAMFKENTFYVVAGSDSGLLYQHVKNLGVPKGSRYLFVELPQVLALFRNIEAPGKDVSQDELVITGNENWLEIANEMGAKNYALLEQLVLLRSLAVVHGHYSEYPPFYRRLKKEFDTFHWDQQVTLGNRPFFISQIENLTENQVPALYLKNTFIGKTAVVLAGGPSLDELLPWVCLQRENLLVISVSRISRTLIQAGIQPDISVSIDPHAINLNVSREILEFQEGTVLVNEFHLSPNLLSSWGGLKVFTGPRYPWITPKQPENLAPTAGTTVTNTAFALAVEMGVGQIVLGGADFCFSQKGYTHASGTVEHAIGPRPHMSDQQVETNSGMMADTINAYVESAKPLNEMAQSAMNMGCRVINPAPGAMRLPNVEYIPVEDIKIEKMQYPSRVILADSIPPTDKNTLIKLYKEVLGEVDRVLKELTAIKVLSSKALDYNHKLFAKGIPGAGFHNKDKVERIEQQLNEKYASTGRFIRAFGAHHFLPIRLLDEDRHVEDLEEGCRLYHQAFVDTSTELIDILRLARIRTMSRLEEENPHPNLQRLLEQWNNDQQPGRAILWAKKHENHVNQLTSTQQGLLTKYQETFENSIDEIGHYYRASIERGIDLDSVVGVSQEYFLAKDIGRLLRLLTGLQEQHNQKQASLFIPLVEGYLAELRNEPTVAIDNYQSIVKGPAYVNALMRLFELHSQKHDYESSLATLKTLSGISPTFCPMYADMLQATGNVDSAAEIYTDHILANPDDLDTMMKLGKLYQQNDMTDGVKWTMNYILDKDSNNREAEKILSEIKLNEESGMSPP